MGSGRNEFTSRDEDYLLQYIAKYNPLPNGRLGVNLYKTLEDNAGKKWPWSRRHPWQSWREYYKKHQHEFDRKIIRLQREQTAAAEGETNAVAGPSKVAGSSKEPIVHAPTRVPTNGSKVKTTEVPMKRVNGATQSHSGATPIKQEKPTPSKVEPRRPSPTSDSRPPKVSIVAPPAKPVTRTASMQRRPQEDEHVSDSQGEDEEDDDEETEVPSGPVGDDDYMHELFGSYVESDDEEVKPEESKTPAPSSPGYPEIYPNIQDAPEPSMPEKDPHVPGAFDVEIPPVLSQEPTPPTSAQSRHHLRSPVIPPQPPKKLKRKVLHEEDDFFGTPPDSPLPTRQALQTKGNPPVLQEGPFRNVYKQARAVYTTKEKGDKPWFPTNRGKKRAKPVDVEMLEPETSVRHVAPQKAKERPPVPRIAAPKGKGLPIPPQQHVNAVASSSKVQLPGAKTSQPAQKRQKLDHHNAHPKPAAPSRTASTTLVNRTSSTHTLPVNVSDNDIFTSSTSAAIKSKPRTTGDKPVPHIDFRASLRRRSSVRSSLVAHAADSAATSTTSASDLQRRDRSRRRESNMSSHSNISSADAEILSIVKRDLAALGARYGFALEVVEKTVRETGSLENAKVVLEYCRNQLDRSLQELLKNKPALFAGVGTEGDEDEDSEVPEGVIPRQYQHHHTVSASGGHDDQREEDSGNRRIIPQPQHQQPVEVASGGRDGQREMDSVNRRHSSTSARRPRQSLTIRPLPSDEEGPLSDYSPPTKSRAGRYMRLAREGREHEALVHRRAYTEEPWAGRMLNGLGASPMTNPSPTPRLNVRDAAMIVDHEELTGKQEDEVEDDMYVDEQEAGREYEGETHQTDADDEYEQEFEQEAQLVEHDMNVEEEEEEIRPPSPQQPGTKTRRNSRRHATLYEEDDDPVQVGLAAEHRRLALNVTTENSSRMREFEKRVDPNLVRRWTAKWVKEMLDECILVQEERKEKDRIKQEQEQKKLRSDYNLQSQVPL